MIQRFDPPGSGARDLQECLELQLRQKLEKEKENESLDLAYEIVSKHFDRFSEKSFFRLLSVLEISETELKAAFDEIFNLNRKPASVYVDASKIDECEVYPDFISVNIWY